MYTARTDERPLFVLCVLMRPGLIDLGVCADIKMQATYETRRRRRRRTRQHVYCIRSVMRARVLLVAYRLRLHEATLASPTTRLFLRSPPLQPTEMGHDVSYAHGARAPARTTIVPHASTNRVV